MDIPLFLLNKFTCETKEEVFLRLVQLLKQELFDLNLFKNNHTLCLKIVTFYENPLELKRTLHDTISHENQYARVYLIMCLLLYELSTDAKDVLNKITNAIYFNLAAWDISTHDKRLICYNVLDEEIIIREEVI